ncbi:MAG TPA: histidine phosphatase family protein [Candidatus Binatia bacterium]|nr:histidine phosphatase family protein [Candidatus Binatia bacterium]
MRRLYLMRHGETLYLGAHSEDGTDLTPAGRVQVERVADTFGGVALDLLVSSPAVRARGTAQIVAARHGLEVEIDEDLREITPGRLDGMELTDIFADVVRFFSGQGVTAETPFLGGETFGQVRARTLGAVARLLARPRWTNALAVAHGGANMALLAGLLGLEGGGLPPLEQDLACINVIDFHDDGRPIVRLVNLSVHDPLKGSHREPSFERLRRVLGERGEQLRGLRWSGGDPPV